MSLLDSLLLDPYRDPRSIYISRRSDGQRGSGTVSDPFDGGTRPGSAFEANLTCKRREFVVGTQFAHGLQPADVGSEITVDGARGPGAGWFNGKFTITEILSPIHFVVEFRTTPTGLPSAPPNVESAAFALITVIYADGDGNQNHPLPTTARIYWPVAKVAASQDLGFPTFGGVRIESVSTEARYQGDYAILSPGASGQSFRYRLKFLPDDDVFPTVLSCQVRKLTYRFDEVMRATLPYSVIHLGPGTFETRGIAPVYISNPNDYSQLYVGYGFQAGQRLLGSGIGATIIKLVLPVDGINQTTAVGTGLVTDHAEVADLTIDCNGLGHEAPFGIFPAPVTCGAVGLGGGFMTIRRVRAINFCAQGRAESFVLVLSQHFTNAAGAVFNVIADCIIEQPSENNTHETTLLGNVGEAVAASARSPIVRHNYVNCSYADGVSSEQLRIEQITYDSTKAIVKTYRPHHRTVNADSTVKNNARLSNVLKKIGVDGSGNPILVGCFDDAFPITDWVSETEFKIKKPDDAPASAMDLYYEDPASSIRASLGVDFHGPAALSGTGCVTEGNSVYDCRLGSYTDTGSTRDAVLRDNYYSNVFRGVWHDLTSPDVKRAGMTLTLLAGSSPPTAEYETIVPHRLSRGQAVEISDAQPAPNYRGVFTVKDRLDDVRFTYEPRPSSDGTVPAPTAVGQYAARWQTNHFVIENNCYDLYSNDPNSAGGPTGIITQGNGQINPFLFPQLVINGNIIGSIDNAPDTGGFLLRTRGMFVDSVENCIISQNIISTAEIFPIAYFTAKNIRTVNNQNSKGDVIRAQLFFGASISDDLATLIEDAMVLAF